MPPFSAIAGLTFMEERAPIVLFREMFGTWEEALEAFILFRKAEWFAERTLKDYRYTVSRFFREHPKAWDPSTTRAAVLSFLGQDGIAPATFNIRRKYLKAFFSWLVEEGAFPETPVRGIRARKAEPRVVQHSTQILQELLRLPDKSTYCGKRDYALMCLSLDTAIRPSEALSLLIEDVDPEDMVVNIRASIAKTRKSRILPFSTETAKSIQAMVIARPKEWGSTFLFTNHEGKQFSLSAWTQRLKKKYAPRLGLKRLSPYDLRHDAALHSLRNGMNPFALQALMGHSDLETTKQYIALLDADIREAHKKASPIKKLLGENKRVR
jgi:site-specific recombinase XerD